ncbi:MAG: hypothetical protein IJL06_06420 [Kiritimatiellae bacterium]|nr:hypothetical protein [Kiritimatiellia bacterium]MBQ6924103.1 hypothetical protein [Kiritimatiellia bacterium]
MAIGTIVPVSVVAFFAFVLASFASAWSGGSSNEPVATTFGAGILAFAVLCVPAALLCKGVRGVRPVYTMVLASLALAVGEAVPRLAIGWLLVCTVPLYSPDVTDFLRTRRPRRGGAANDAASWARSDRAGVLSLWFFSVGLGVLMLFARDQERALACAAGWLATSVWLVAKARPGDSPKWALVPTLCVFATIAGFHVLWAATPRSWTDPASWTLIASIAETLLASAVLFLRHAIASRRLRRFLCAGVVLSTLALWYATGFTIEHYTIC